MIFSLKQGMYTGVLLGDKTLTTRLKLPAHIRKGAIWAIVPGRAKPAWWIARNLNEGTPLVVTNPREYAESYNEVTGLSSASINWWMDHVALYTQAAILIDDFYQSPLGDMDDADGKAESCGDLAGFIKVWNAINPKLPFAFNMSYPVWRIRFRRQDIVREAVERIGRDAIRTAAQRQLAAPTQPAVE